MSAALLDVRSSADLILTATQGLDQAITTSEYTPDEVDGLVEAYLVAVEAKRELSVAIDALASKIGYLMGDKRLTVAGVTVERNRLNVRTQWDKEALLSSVLDSRRLSAVSGEPLDESQLQKVLHVFNLPAPRTTALRERGIDPDQFCATERRDGWSLRIHGGDQ